MLFLLQKLSPFKNDFPSKDVQDKLLNILDKENYNNINFRPLTVLDKEVSITKHTFTIIETQVKLSENIFSRIAMEFPKNTRLSNVKITTSLDNLVVDSAVAINLESEKYLFNLITQENPNRYGVTFKKGLSINKSISGEMIIFNTQQEALNFWNQKDNQESSNNK